MKSDKIRKIEQSRLKGRADKKKRVSKRDQIERAVKKGLKEYESVFAMLANE